MNSAESMRRDWDDRARKNSLYYIASWREEWDLPAFFQSGEEDYERLVAPTLTKFGFSPSGKTMLDVGCGVGRMARAFSSRFARVSALDLSSEMLEQAKQLLWRIPNISLVHANGIDLRPLADESVDFVFSYLVLQHLPEESLVQSYVREMIRVLSPSGLCLFQFNGSERSAMNWRGRLAWGLINGIWNLHLCIAARAVAKFLGLDPRMAGKSWHGPAISGSRIEAVVCSAGGEVLEIRGTGTPMAWCCARKPNSIGASIPRL